MSRRTVVFLGAGASVPHGYPTIPDVLPRIWKGLADGSWKRWGGLKGEKRRRQSAKRVADLRAILRTLVPGLERGGNVLAGASITDVISLVDQLLAEGRSPLPGFSEDGLHRARSTLQLALNGVLQGQLEPDLRNEFAAWILSEASKSAGRVALISTNYDTIVEQEIFDRVIQHGASIGGSIDLGVSWRDAFRPELHMRPKQARLAILKLHGSLNWVRCEVCGHLTINVRQRIATMEFWPRVTRYNECWCGGRLRSVIVTPSYVRDIRDANLLSIWNASVDELRNADDWIVVGYSLPSEDIAIRSILLRAFHTRVKRAGLRIRVVQFEKPNAGCTPSPTRQRYEAFFPIRNLRPSDYLTGGLAEFVRAQRAPRPSVLRARLALAFPKARHAQRP